MTDDLLDRLAANANPVPRRRLPALLVAAGIVGILVAATIMVPWIGLRPDLAAATGTMIFWWKFAYTALFSIAAFFAVERLSRPGGSFRRPAVWIMAVIALAGLLGAIQLMMTPPDEMRPLVMGSTSLVCPFYIATLSVPIYAAIVLVMRRLAPTNLSLAGFGAGLLAGAAASWVYAFHCNENGMPFLAIWYTTGILISAVLGAIAGRWTLRW